MARYTFIKTVAGCGAIYGIGASAETRKFELPIPDFKDFTIKNVTVDMSVTFNDWIDYHFEEIKVGSFSRTVGGSKMTKYVWNDVNATGVTSISHSIKCSQFYSEGSRWIATVNSITYTIDYEADTSSSTVHPLSGDNISSSLSTEFSWSNFVPAGNIVEQSLYWKQKEQLVYNKIELDPLATSYEFNGGTFNNGDINWYVLFVDDSGNEIQSPIETVTVGIVPSVAIAYPNNVNIRNSNKQLFTWEMTEAIATGQKSYEIQYKKTSEEQWTTIIETAGKQYHEFEANTFDTDVYEWKLKVTNNDDISTDFVSASFIAIGATDAPNITSITNSSIPTINWETSSQDTFEVEIYTADDRIYASGIQVGKNVRSFTPNIMLDDGNYIVKMRSMNEYGYFTEWSDYSFVLNATKPDAVDCMVYANECHGVNIEAIGSNSNNLYVLRRKFGASKWNIIGKLQDVFTDNTILTNVKYEYALRNYQKNAGYADSSSVSIVIEHKGSIIYDGNEFVQLYVTEDEQFNISHRPSKSYTYSYMIGRTYPVREASEWMSHSTSLSCFVLFEEYEKLERFYQSNDPLWFKGDNFSFKCSIDGLQIKETLLGKGYEVSIDLSRTDEEEVMLIE